MESVELTELALLVLSLRLDLVSVISPFFGSSTVFLVGVFSSGFFFVSSGFLGSSTTGFFSGCLTSALTSGLTSGWGSTFLGSSTTGFSSATTSGSIGFLGGSFTGFSGSSTTGSSGFCSGSAGLTSTTGFSSSSLGFSIVTAGVVVV